MAWFAGVPGPATRRPGVAGGRLQARQPASEVVAHIEARGQKPKNAKITAEDTPAGLGALGKMKGRYAQVLADFWSGRLQMPDTLNQGIRLLALPLPYYRSEDEAVALIDSYIDDLPDYSFSDRLSAGDLSEVSRVVRNTVRQVYDGNGGQPDPELSTQKLKATVAAWQRRGFDPTDKGTWAKVGCGGPVSLAKDFCWKPEEVMKRGTIQKVLSCPLQAASEAVKHLLRLVKGHTGELAMPFVQRLLEGFGINCRHHGKENQFLALLRHWDWIRVTAWERWHQRKAEGAGHQGRARTFAIGEALQHKFEDRAASGGRSGRAEAYQPAAVGEWWGCPLPGGEKKRILQNPDRACLAARAVPDGSPRNPPGRSPRPSRAMASVSLSLPKSRSLQSLPAS